MHGRQRIDLTPEEEAKKKKERATKVAAYQYAMKKIFDKRSKSELDLDMLNITGQVLAANPDISTLWGIRKTTLLKMKEEDLKNFVEVVVPKEFDFSEFCLKSNPKSYGAWHHRYWLMKETDFNRVAQELKLCSKYLEYDDRNFHTWNYRRFLLDNCSLVTLEQEIQFTTDKISSNFSNFSSWHLRSKLLPQVSTNYLDEELELIRNAVFTDPKDQSAWLYHSWLLKSQLEKDLPKLTLLQLTTKHLIMCFNLPVSSPKENGLEVSIKTADWSNPWSASRSKLWMLIINDPDAINKIGLTLSGPFVGTFLEEETLTLQTGRRILKLDQYFDDETKPKSPELTKLLRDELSWVLELHDLEPDIKWPTYSAITLMRMVDFIEFKPQILELVEQLKEIDTKRTNYYNDLKSKFVIEWILADKGTWDNEEMDLSRLGLTALYYPERLSYKKNVNCSDNALKSGASLAGLLTCENLNISNNQIHVDTNLVKTLQSLPNLKSITLFGNPDFEMKNVIEEFTASVKVS